MAIGPVGHPRKRRIKFVAVAAIAVSDPRWPRESERAAPLILNGLLLDQHGHAWWWDGVTERGTRIRMQPSKSGSPRAARTNRTRRNTRNK